MVVTTYAASVLLFLLAFHHLKIGSACKCSFEVMRGVVRTLTDKTLGDNDKEAVVRKAGLRMVQMSLSLVLRLLLLLVSVLAPVWLSDFAGLSSFSQTARFALRIEVIVLTGIAVYLFLVLLRKSGFKPRSGHG